MTITLGVVIFNAGVLLSYYSVQCSITLFILTFGAFHGFGAGFLYGPSLETSLEWRKHGIVTSILQCSYNIGAVVMNELVTLLVNPHNIVPNERRADFVTFTHKDIVDRVPYVFLYIGASVFSVQLAGMCLMRIKFSKRPERVGLTSNDSYSRSQEQNSFGANGMSSNEAAFKISDVSPRQMLRTQAFYILWLSHFLGYYSLLIITSQYKAFGQLFIRDDHFLSYIGTASVSCAIVTKFIIGALVDMFGYKIN